MTLDHQQSPRLGQRPAVASTGVQLATLETLPENAFRGQMVFRLDINNFAVFDGVAWQNPEEVIGVAGAQTFVGPDPPVADAVGDLWMNTTTYQLSTWTGTEWQFVVDPVAEQAAADASNALVQAEAALGLATGKTTIWYLPSQPTDPAVVAGDYWLNTTTNTLYYTADGATWNDVQDDAIAAAVNAAGTAQATADQKISTYTMAWADRPVDLGPEDIGDLFYAVDQGNKAYRWDGADWVELSRSQMDSVEIGTSLSLASGSISHIQNAATVMIDGSAHRPSLPPTFLHDYETLLFTLTTPPSTSWAEADTVEFTGCAYDITTGLMYQAINFWNPSKTKCKAMLYTYDFAARGGEIARSDISINETNSVLDVTVSGTKLYVLTRPIGGAPIIRVITKATMLFQALNRALADTSLLGLYANATYVHVARASATTHNLQLSRFDATTLFFVDSLDTTQPLTAWGRGCKQVLTAPGIAGNKFIVNISGSSAEPLFCSFDPNTATSTMTRVAAESWDSLPTNVAGFFHDGTNFYQTVPPSRLTGNDWHLTKYTNDAWTVAADGTRWASAAFRAVDSGTGTTTYQTSEGPRVQITARKRMRLTVTGPTLAVTGDSNAVSLYLGKGTVEPTLANMHLQTPEPAIADRTIRFDDARPPSFTGVAPLLVGTFPDGVPGALVSQSLRLDGAPKTNLDGLGTASVDGLIPPASIILSARSGAPAGWHLCDGAAISRTGFPDLFAVLGTTYGAGNGTTTFNVPTKTDASLFYLIKL